MNINIKTMAKVITFSKTFPSYHPKVDEATLFPEKLFNCFLKERIHKYSELNTAALNEGNKHIIHSIYPYDSKGHTIRARNRFKEGEYFSPRIWSGTPRRSKQVILAPDTKILKIWDFKMIFDTEIAMLHIYVNNSIAYLPLQAFLARNDGLSTQDFIHWFMLSPEFKKTNKFEGQIIYWSEKPINEYKDFRL
jgi:hypothetical protein